MSPRRRGRATDDRFADAPLDGPLLEVDGVQTFFKTPRGLVHAVDGVSLTLERGKTIGVVGESGSGKSVLSRSIMGLLPGNVERHGSIKFEGREIGNADSEIMRRYWGTQMSMVFQDPMTSLNPVMRIGNQITESLRYHLDVTQRLRERDRVGAAPVGRDSRGRTPAAGVPAPALGRDAPARDDRDRAGLRSASSCSPTSRPPRSTSPCRRRSSTCCRRSSGSGSWRWCS